MFVGSTSVFQKLSGIKKFLDIRNITFSSKCFRSRDTENIRRGALLSVRKTLFSKTYMDTIKQEREGEREWEKESARERVSRISVDYLLSHSTETFRGEHFSVLLTSGIVKFWAQQGYVTIFCWDVFFWQYQLYSEGNPSVFQEHSDIETFLDIRRIMVLSKHFWSHNTEIFRRGAP